MIRRILDALLYKEEVKPYDRIEPFENNVKYMYSDTQVDPNTIDGLTKMQNIGSISAVKQEYDKIHRTANDNTVFNSGRSLEIKQAYDINLGNPSANRILGAPQVFAVGPGYQYTFDEAPAVCAKYGAQVATTAQLEEAQRNGADWCFSGWVAEGRQGKWPITLNPIIGCGQRTGIIEWTPGDRAGINCYGPKPDINDPVAQNVIFPFNQQMWNQPPPSDKPTYLTIPSGYLETNGPQPSCFSGLSLDDAQKNCNALSTQCAGFSYSKDGMGNGCYKGNHNGGMNNNSAYMGYVKIQVIPGPSVISGRYIRLQYNRVECLNLRQILVYSKLGGPNIIKPTTLVTKSSGFQGDVFPSKKLVDGLGTSFTHTSCNDIPWIQIDLGASVTIYKIVVVNRKDCCQSRILGTTLSILDEENATTYLSNAISTVNQTYTWLPPNPSVKGDIPEDRFTPPRQWAYGDNGTVSCNRYCGGTGNRAWNGELPNEWNGAHCVQVDPVIRNCDSLFTSHSGAGCLCEANGTGWR